MLDVASEKARKNIITRWNGGRSKRRLPKPKMNIHPDQLSTLQALKYSLDVSYQQMFLQSIITN